MITGKNHNNILALSDQYSAVAVTCGVYCVGNLIFSPEIICDQLKLFKCSFEVVYDFAGDNVGFGEVFGIFKAVVFEPEDVEACFVAVYQFFVIECRLFCLCVYSCCTGNS